MLILHLHPNQGVIGMPWGARRAGLECREYGRGGGPPRQGQPRSPVTVRGAFSLGKGLALGKIRPLSHAEPTNHFHLPPRHPAGAPHESHDE